MSPNQSRISKYPSQSQLGAPSVEARNIPQGRQPGSVMLTVCRAYWLAIRTCVYLSHLARDHQESHGGAAKPSRSRHQSTPKPESQKQEHKPESKNQESEPRSTGPETAQFDAGSSQPSGNQPKPDSPPEDVTKSRLAEQCREKGNTAFRAENFERAIEQYTEAIGECSSTAW